MIETNIIEDNLNIWCESLLEYHVPRWEELPDIELYKDQVITIVDKYLLPIIKVDKGSIITSAMVNNYVKLGLIPAPKKKKYNRVHLAYLIAIGILKQVVTISEVRDGIEYQASIKGTKIAYNMFALEQENSIKAIVSLVSNRNIEIPTDKYSVENLALKMAAMAFANKIVAEKMVELEAPSLKIAKAKKEK
ncbi:MAG: DUF1836 domain-containing protein [Erysipelotrichaceae bacterium]